MRHSDFIQTTEHFSFNTAECLRNAYVHNACERCIECCPTDAFALIRNKLTLLEAQCIACAACIGSCPTESLSVESFDPNAFTLLFRDRETKELSCQSNTPCLGVFDSYHYIAMALRSEDAPECHLSYCEGCHLNDDGNVEAAIRQNIMQSNMFLDAVGMPERRINIIEESDKKAHDRRMFFREALSKVHEVMRQNGDKDPALTTLHQQQRKTALPLKYTLLKNSMKEHIEAFTTTTLEGFQPLFFNKSIDFNACTNCGDCIQFCPTEALFATSDKQGILFKSGMCIGCGICDDICKSRAMTTVAGVDLVAIAFDKGRELVHYEMVMCHECRCPYPYKGGDPICDRCRDFTDNFEEMFVLAKDQ